MGYLAKYYDNTIRYKLYLYFWDKLFDEHNRVYSNILRYSVFIKIKQIELDLDDIMYDYIEDEMHNL